MAKRTVRIIVTTLFGLLSLGLAWFTDYVADQPAYPNKGAIALVSGGFSIACLVIAILFICKAPPCLKNSPQR